MVTTVLVLILALAVVAIVLVVVHGRPGSSPVASAQTTPAATKTSAVPEPTAEPMTAEETDVDYDASTPQATFYRLSDGFHTGSASERHARPALSLSKLYIAEFVIEHGDTADGFEAIQMLSDSDDGVAQELYEKYPDSIDEVAEEHRLHSTEGANHWGNSVTSTFDVVKFLSDLMVEEPHHPILVALTMSAEVAADGYEQDFGTAVLPGELGTKWGWSDDRSLHSSVSFGEDYVAAAAVAGTPEDLTNYAEEQFGDLVEETVD